MDFLINIDVPDLEVAIKFYRDAFGFVLARRLGAGVAELTGAPARVYLLEKPEGSIGAGRERRRYARHWTPVHFDIVVDDIESARARAVAAGAIAEAPVSVAAWGKLALLADPFGHGFCLIEFLGRGYGELEGVELGGLPPPAISGKP
jgi:predicted enzyme related to lactoylglutathione lyase